MIAQRGHLRSSRRKGQRGSSMLEMSLAFSVYFAFIFGTIEFGLATWTYNMTSFLAHEGARYASTHGNASTAPASASDITTYIKSIAVGVDTSALVVNTTWPNSNSNAPGNPVKVQVLTTFGFVAPVSPADSSGGPVTNSLKSISMGSTSQMIISQ